MAVTTATELCQLIEKSNILAAGPLEKAKKFAETEADAKSLARTLLEQKLLTSWQARQLMAGVAGLRMGKYVLLDELGRGDLGRVYLAEHTQLVRRAALKLLSRELCENKDLLRRFLGEARLIASLDHPNVVHTLDVSSEGERYYVVFEYVVGRDLAKLVAEQGRLPADAAAALILQVADGLVHAHEKGVVHADLKPGNLMVDAQGNIKILDIGVDRLGISLQAANAAAGRPATTPSLFRAPELARGVEHLTPQSDLFSLGMIFVFLVTGENPPPPDADLGQTHSDAILSQLSIACPDLPEELAQLCGKLTAEQPEDRFASVAALRDTLRGWLASHAAPVDLSDTAEAAAEEFVEEASAGGEEASDVEPAEPAPVIKIIPSKNAGSPKGPRSTTVPTPATAASAASSAPAKTAPATKAATSKPGAAVATAATGPVATSTAGKPAGTRPAASGQAATGSAATGPTISGSAPVTGKTGGTAAATAATTTKPNSASTSTSAAAGAGAAAGASAAAGAKTAAAGAQAKTAGGVGVAKGANAGVAAGKGPATAAANAGPKTTTVGGKPGAASTKPTGGPGATGATAAVSKTTKKSATAEFGTSAESGVDSLDPLGEGDASSSFLAESASESSSTDAAVETSLSFTVKTGGKRPAGKGGKPAAKPKAKSTANAAATAAGGTDADGAAEGGESAKPARKIPLWVWVAGGSGVAGVTLIVLIIALVVVMLGGSNKSDQVAQTSGAGTGGAGTGGAGTGGTGAAGTGAAGDAGAATGAGGDATANPGGADPNNANPAGANAAGNSPAGAVDPLTGNPVAGAVTPNAGTPAGTAPGTTPPGGTPSAAAPDPLAILLGGGNAPSGNAPSGTTPNPAAPGTTPPTDPAAPKPGTPMPMPAPTAPAPATPAPTAPAPTAPAPMPKPTPPPPKPVGDPLKDFPKEFIELPALAKDAPVPGPASLGKIAMPPKAVPIIHLLGGEGAIKGKSRFVMESSDGGTAERDWDVFLREGEVREGETGGVKVAHLSLKESDLLFNWEADAPNQLASPYLINCMLQVSAGQKQATVALRKPLEAEPLKAEILKGTLKGKFDVPFPPNPDRMKVEIVFDGPFPPLKFEGQNPMDADKGKATVWFGASQETQILALRLDTALRRQLEIGFDPHVRIGTTAKPEKLTAVGLGKMQKQAQVARQQTFAMVEMAKKATAGKNDETTQQRLSLMESQLTGITKASEQLEGLKGMAEQLLQGGRIHVRIFSQVDDFKLELVRTTGMPASGQK